MDTFPQKVSILDERALSDGKMVCWKASGLLRSKALGEGRKAGCFSARKIGGHLNFCIGPQLMQQLGPLQGSYVSSMAGSSLLPLRSKEDIVEEESYLCIGYLAMIPPAPLNISPLQASTCILGE